MEQLERPRRSYAALITAIVGAVVLIGIPSFAIVQLVTGEAWWWSLLILAGILVGVVIEIGAFATAYEQSQNRADLSWSLTYIDEQITAEKMTGEPRTPAKSWNGFWLNWLPAETMAGLSRADWLKIIVSRREAASLSPLTGFVLAPRGRVLLTDTDEQWARLLARAYRDHNRQLAELPHQSGSLTWDQARQRDIEEIRETHIPNVADYYRKLVESLERQLDHGSTPAATDPHT